MRAVKVIFLDLDRSLLGEDYSPEGGRDVVEGLIERGFEVVLNSSKTMAEQKYYREAWGLRGPFIVENGSAVVIPWDYFPFEISGRKAGDYVLIELGEVYPKIRNALESIEEKYGLKYYGNSTIEEVMTFTGLPRELAVLAMRRDYSETIFQWKKGGFEVEIEGRGLRLWRGSRFINVTGDTDKGRAARLLLSLYSRVGKVESYALGDAPNDFPLFDVVDHAFLVGNLRYPGAKNISSPDELLEVVI